MTDQPERCWVTIRRHELGVLLAVAYAMLERAAAQHPLPSRTWEVAQAVEGAERAMLAADTERPAPERSGPAA